MNLIDEIKRSFTSGSMLIKLLLINVGVFLFVRISITLASFYYTGDTLINFYTQNLAAKANVLDLLFTFWTAVTYMFYHYDGSHIFYNMLIFFFTGRIFIHVLGEKRLLPVYLLSGFSGLLLFILAYNIFPVFLDKGYSVILGASAAVIGVFVAVGTYKPNYPVNFFFLPPIALKWIVMAYLVYDFLTISPSPNQLDGNAGGHISHLGGAIMGFIYGSQLIKGNDLSNWFYNLSTRFKNIFKRKNKLKVKYTKPVSHMSDEEFNQFKHTRQEQIDAVLDKISKSGYDSLTKAEKQLLFSESNEK